MPKGRAPHDTGASEPPQRAHPAQTEFYTYNCKCIYRRTQTHTSIYIYTHTHLYVETLALFLLAGPEYFIIQQDPPQVPGEREGGGRDPPTGGSDSRPWRRGVTTLPSSRGGRHFPLLPSEEHPNPTSPPPQPPRGNGRGEAVERPQRTRRAGSG